MVSRRTLFLVLSAAPILVLATLGVLLLSSFAAGQESAVKILGPASVVFDWSKDGCETTDFPDLPARAFRGRRGRTQLIISNPTNRRMVGPNLGQLRRDCSVIMSSDDDRRPSAFNGREWIAAPYTSDGKRVFALVHNEFQGHLQQRRCPSRTYFKCWYNAVTLAVSNDGGKTYRDARRPPAHLVASYPARYVPDRGPVGIFEPSNIVLNPKDGYFYAVARVIGPRSEPRGTCVFRTRRLGDPGSWRWWDGSAFEGRFVNPYRSAGVRPSACRPVDHDDIQEMSQSLTYNTYFDRFLLVGTASLGGRDSRRGKWGISYSLSDNLIHWTERKLIMAVETPWTYRCGDPKPVLYPSVLDPNSTSRSFETTGQHVYLFLTRLNYSGCKMGSDRDLIRLPLEFSK